MTGVGYERMERKSLLAGTPQEVIITICKGEVRAGGGGRGGHPIGLLWHRDKTLFHTTRLHVACMYAQMPGNEHAHTDADVLWASGCCREFPEESRAVECCYTMLCCLVQGALIATETLCEVCRIREISAFVGRTKPRKTE